MGGVEEKIESWAINCYKTGASKKGCLGGLFWCEKGLHGAGHGFSLIPGNPS